MPACARLLECLLVSYTASLNNSRFLTHQVSGNTVRTTHTDGCLERLRLAFLGMLKKNASEIDQTTAYAAARVAP